MLMVPSVCGYMQDWCGIVGLMHGLHPAASPLAAHADPDTPHAYQRPCGEVIKLLAQLCARGRALSILRLGIREHEDAAARTAFDQLHAAALAAGIGATGQASLIQPHTHFAYPGICDWLTPKVLAEHLAGRATGAALMEGGILAFNRSEGACMLPPLISQAIYPGMGPLLPHFTGAAGAGARFTSCGATALDLQFGRLSLSAVRGLAAMQGVRTCFGEAPDGCTGLHCTGLH